MSCFQIFGPVQSILKFDTLEEVLDRANATNYGLGAGIITKNLEAALQYSKHVEAGIVWYVTPATAVFICLIALLLDPDNKNSTGRAWIFNDGY